MNTAIQIIETRLNLRTESIKGREIAQEWAEHEALQAMHITSMSDAAIYAEELATKPLQTLPKFNLNQWITTNFMPTLNADYPISAPQTN